MNKLWVFGDSFSSPSIPDFDESNHLYKNDFRVKYSNIKGYYPKHFPEIVSEILNLELINLAIPSTSNDQIFHSFIENIHLIKNEDVLFFGWTYVSRFNLANRFNQFENINIAREGDYVIDDFVSNNSINEILLNRGRNTIYYKWVSNYIKLINFQFKNNIIIHTDFFDHGSNDDYVLEYIKNLTFKINPERIFEDIKYGYDLHLSENGHKHFSDVIVNFINSAKSHVL